ncbi:MAG: hypothetical protein A2V89_05000 [Gammaproteobacteria bacterium RBG_16_37_9]|nr:MAG: hypothetical protein A2V89_05000 [Gammaproteobacteria bacterium RBG_16_37_9]
MYKIVFTSGAAKQLEKLGGSEQKLIVRKIKKLDIGQPNNNIKKLIGIADLYRLRIGNYRVIYQVRHKELVILVLKIGHRNDVYRGISKLGLPNI